MHKSPKEVFPVGKLNPSIIQATMELRTLYGFEEELASLDEILEESKNVFTAAQQAVDLAAAALTPFL